MQDLLDRANKMLAENHTGSWGEATIKLVRDLIALEAARETVREVAARVGRRVGRDLPPSLFTALQMVKEARPEELAEKLTADTIDFFIDKLRLAKAVVEQAKDVSLGKKEIL